MMVQNRHVSFARPDSANVAFSSVHHERSDGGGPYEEQQPLQQPQQSASLQDGGPWTSSLQSSSIPRGYPAESYVPSQHQQHPAYQQHNTNSVGRPHPSAGWHPPSGSTASARGDDSAESAVADPALRVAKLPADPPQAQGRSQQQRPSRAPPAEAYGRPPAVPSTAPSQGPPMQFMQSHLAGLNAEQYDDGHGRGGGTRNAGPAAPRKVPQQPETEEPASKKKGRGNAQPAVRVVGEPEEDKKRTRGRPRLETTSETPQERRRTQIRLAQRAYRDRKEGAISTLEKEVEDLKAEKQKVTKAYEELLARVQGGGGGGFLDPPGSSAKRPARDDSDSDSPPPDDTQQQRSAKRARRDASDDGILSSSSTTMTTGPMQHFSQAAAQQPTPLWAGVMVTHEPHMMPASSFPTPFAGSAVGGADFFGGGATGVPGGYEVLAQATPQNASFAPALAFDAVWPPPPGVGMSASSWAFAAAAGAAGGGPSPLSLLPTPSPLSLLAAPANFAYQEATFGRRLHRSLLQRAARLAAMAHPPPAALARVFGFAMLFESLDQIKARTLALLSPAERASLFEDRYPFQNLGGAGSHYPAANPAPPPPGRRHGDYSEGQPLSSSPPLPSSSSSDAASPLDRDPYAMGPMDPRVAKIRDTLVSLGGQIALPGFDGIFWDPEEVDFYLRHNGVIIPPCADHHIVEILDGAFGPPPVSPSTTTAATTSTSDADGPSASASSAVTATTSSGGFHDHPGASAAQPQQKANPLCGASWSFTADFLDAHYTTTAAAAAAPSDLTYTYDAHSGGGGGGGGGAPDMHNMGYAAAGPRRRVWRMNVELFVDNLTAKTTCLGRSPGIRPGDVDAAFWASVSDPTSAL